MAARAKVKAKVKAKRNKVDRPRQPGSPYTLAEAALALRLAPRTVRQRIADGLLRAYRDGRRVLVAEADLDDYQARLRPAAAPASGGTARHLLGSGTRGRSAGG